MKTTFHPHSIAAIFAAAFTTISVAQPPVPPVPPPPVPPAPPAAATITVGRGTITKFVPGKTFIVREEPGPVTYFYGPKVTYVTRKGTVIVEKDLPQRIRTGVPVAVEYVTEGGTRVIKRVEVDIDDD